MAHTSGHRILDSKEATQGNAGTERDEALAVTASSGALPRSAATTYSMRGSSEPDPKARFRLEDIMKVWKDQWVPGDPLPARGLLRAAENLDGRGNRGKAIAWVALISILGGIAFVAVQITR
ncbi:MAG TPA: hypothetical protein VHB69_07685 [Mycobacteriales bacterium]|nr:hypothetical protein [Mycobacteriales bacterium]